VLGIADLIWHKKLEYTWRNTSKGTINYDKEMPSIGAITKDTDEHDVHFKNNDLHYYIRR
jgi:hypothetical protein